MIVVVLRQFQKDLQKQTSTELNNEVLSLIELMRLAHRKDIYSIFP